MKIGYLMQSGVPDIRRRPLSGPAVHVRHVFNNLQRMGHKMKLLAVFDGRIWRSSDLANFRPVFIPWLDKGPFRWFERFVRRIQYEVNLPYAALFESFRFARACQQELGNCDLFYERMGWMGYGGSLAARWMNTPLVLEVNGDHLTEFDMLGIVPQGAQRWLSMWLMKQAVHRTTHVVATGEGHRQTFIERWQVPPDIVTVVENGSEMVDRLKRENLRSFQSSDQNSGKQTILYLGALESWHGVEVLVKAYAQVIEKGISAQLLVIGSGTEFERVKSLVKEHNLEQVVMFTGDISTEQIASYLMESDIGVAPYCGWNEYSGLKLFDYKSAGMAAIASGKNGQPSVLEHGRTGWIVPPCDVGALRQALVHLCSDTELRRRIGQAARIEAEQYHSWRQTAQQLQRIFEQIAGE